MTAIIFLVVLAALVFVHELGHFTAAKKLGIRVDEFAVGFPPRVFSKIWKGTRYSLNLIPFGGYVSIFGENPDEENTKETAKDSFQAKPKWAQIIVLLAGVFMNVVFAWMLYTAAFSIGVLSVAEEGDTNAKVTVISVVPDSPALAAGIEVGDAIVSVGSVDIMKVQDVRDAIQASTSTTVSVGVLGADGAIGSVQVDPRVSDSGDRTIGVGLGVVGVEKMPLHIAAWEALKETWYQTGAIVVGTVSLVKDLVMGQADTTMVSGPVGIAGMVGDAAEFGLAQLLMFTAFISLNLAVLNAMPFPALDGGRVLFILIEAIIRRPLPRSFQNYANAAGFLLLMGLIVVLTFRDISRLF